MAQKNAKQWFENHGAFCLTRTYSNIPMWAHYAKNHTGYCLEYTIDYENLQKHSDMSEHDFWNWVKDFESGEEVLEITKDNISFVFTKVRYQKERPIINAMKAQAILKKYGANHEYTKYFVQNSIGVKFIDWKYEKEFRIISNLSGQRSQELAGLSDKKHDGLCDLSGYIPFIKITGIILGHNMPEENKVIIKNDIYNWALESYPISIYESKLSQAQYLIDKTPLFSTKDKRVEA